MGRQSVEVLTVHASVSRHNSSQDDEDDALVEELRERLEDVAKDPHFEAIRVMTW